jgi:Flp pilus assembly protein TadB
MQRHAPRLSRPLYEGLPWLYMAAGIAAIIASYLLSASWIPSLLIGMVGLIGLVGGIVVLLRRRDFRELRSRYSDPGALADDESD